MPWAGRPALVLVLAWAGCGGESTPPDSAAALRVMSVEPAAQGRSALPDTAITVHFDRPVQAMSVTPRAFAVFGRWSGPAQGEFRMSDEGRTVTLVPGRTFQAGEQVTV